MLDVKGKITNTMVQRAYKLQFDRVYDILNGRPFILAGGALSGDQVHDFDVYPDAEAPYTLVEVVESINALKAPDVSLVHNTRNAITVMLREGQIVQFCSYLKPSLKDLVDSFDFSHVQAGVRFAGEHKPPHANGVYYTDEFVLANVTRQTEYTGTEYPTSSLIRTLKYYKRGKLTKGAAGGVLLRIVADILRRGFADYGDFKDQMDAIDLGMPDRAEARDLYETAREAGLVKSESDNQKGNNQ